MARTFLIEATPWDNAGNVVNVYLAGGGSRGYDHRGRTTWIAGIVKEPKFSAAIGFDENGWTGGALPQASNVEFMPSDKATLTSIMSRQWIGAPITILVGDDATAAPAWTTTLTGTVKAVSSSAGKLQFTVADLGAALADPFIKTAARFAGTTGIEGDSDIEGRVKRRTFGRAYNVEGRTLLKASNIFEFGDPAFPLNAFVTVKDMGRAAAPAPTVIAWAGSIAATLAALVASTPAGGSCCVAPSIACVKWWTQPSGPLTADIDGEVGFYFVNKVVEIAGRILAAAGGPAYSGNLGDSYRPDESGIHVEDISESTASLLDRLLLGASLTWVLDPAGTVYIREFTFAGSVETITVEAIDRVEAYKPITSRRVAYRRAYRLHNDGEISAAVLLADIAGAGTLAGLNTVKLGATGQVTESNGFTPVTDASALNNAVTISAGGALAGAGGGQVTPIGLQTASGVGILNTRITVGVDTGGTGGRARVIVLDNGSTLNLVQFPAVAQNLDIGISSGVISGIGTGTGTAIGNSLVTIAANGALSGGGGGQVTIRGVGFLGDLNATAGENGAPIIDSAGTGWSNPYGMPIIAGTVAGDPSYFFRYPNLPNAGAFCYVAGPPFTVTPGDRIYQDGMFRASGTGSRTAQFILYYYDATGTLIGSGDTTTAAIVGTGWQRFTYSASIAPANAVRVNPLWVFINNGAGTSNGDFGDMRIAKSARGATVGSVIGINMILADGVTVATETGSTGVRNNAVTIAANGALSGGGGGQVTIRGVGFAGDLGATNGRNWVVNGDAEDTTTSSWFLDTLYVGGTLSNGTTNPHGGLRAFAITKALVSDAVQVSGRAFAVVPGRTYTLRMWIKGSASSGSGLYCCGLNKSATLPSSGFIDTQNASSQDWAFNNIGAPTSYTLYERLWTCPAGTYFVSPAVAPWTNCPTIYFDDVEFFETPDVEIAGSGHRLGDPRNAVPIMAMNLGYKFTGAITYTAAAGTPATATISVAAGSSLIGSSSVSYSAMSVGVSGTGGTTVTYYLYCDDPAFAGGAQTLVATTTANTIYGDNGRVYIGTCDVFFPTSGTGGGGGGGGGGTCVAADAWVETRERGFVRAREVEAGDELRVLTGDREAVEWATCETNALSLSRGYRIRSKSGIELDLAESTPITLRDGSTIRVCEIDGHALPVIEGDGLRWEPCQAEAAGNFEVAHIRVHQRTYAAGNVEGRSILTHNPTNPKP